MAENWSDQLKKLTTKGGQDLGKVCRAIKIELFSETSALTRVGNPKNWKSKPPKGYVGGRLRGNWQIQENTKPTGEIARIDPQGTAVDAEINAKASASGVTYFVNNLRYAKKYEELDAMVGRSVARARHIVDEQVKKIVGKT